MEGFFIEYRDPLFGIIVFLCIVAGIAFASHIWSRVDTDKKDKNIRKLAKKFDFVGLDEEMLEVFKGGQRPIKQLLFLAQIYHKNGEHQRAIKTYLTILETLTNTHEKVEIMGLLGTCYFEAGFLQRAKDIFMESLRIFPRNKEALGYLLQIHESLGEYDKALEVCDSLFELDCDVKTAQCYLKAQKITQSSFLVFSQKSKELIELYKQEPAIGHIVFEFLRHHDLKGFWANIDSIEHQKIADILWSIQKDELSSEYAKSEYLRELFSAKGFINDAKQSSIFEFDAILALNHCGSHRAELSFEYVCNSCKNIFPLYSARCPICGELFSLDGVGIIQKGRDEKESNSLL